MVALTMEAVRNFNVTTRPYLPKDSKLHDRRREKLKFHNDYFLKQH
jgi:hypothetical protein